MKMSTIGITLASGLLATGLAGTVLASDQLRAQDQLYIQDRDQLKTRDRIHLYTESDDAHEYRDGSRHMVKERAEYRYRVMDEGSSMNGGASTTGNDSGSRR